MTGQPESSSANKPAVAARSEINSWSATEIARRIAAGDVSSLEVTEAFIARIEAVNPRINAIVVPMFDRARADAAKADQSKKRRDLLPPLHGVPITIKECFHVAGTAATMGLTARANDVAEEDGELVRQLRHAGAIVLGKTNVPQLMIWHECDNPLYGRTNNPWDVSRGPSGSSGGEAAIIAAGGSPWGLGSDLGGSIRLPAHACGIHGIKPTSQRLPRSGTAVNLRGMEAVHFQPGPLARHVEDLSLMLSVLGNPIEWTYGADVAPAPMYDPQDVRVNELRVAMWTDDGYFSPSPAIRRVVDEAADALRSAGVTVEEIEPPAIGDAMRLYYSLLGADGGADVRRLLRGSKLDPRVGYLLRAAGCPALLRPATAAWLRWQGHHRQAELLTNARPISADAYWRLTAEMNEYVRSFTRMMHERQFDAVLCPPHALPAMKHNRPINLVPAASYAFMANLLGVPAGVVSLSRVRAGEESDRADSRDFVDRAAKSVERGSAGLPIGVQIFARHWREDIVLALMASLEKTFRDNDDFPSGHEQPTRMK